ncbi:hypothetical protein [Enterobacter oligotrophicus]|uniref:hypothetical protein n=1 Tax=Enterobacter oligotrophicus TaxID=2478464 RepID=UPI0012609C46|nr:hypothetical protein [Enterobacter oligotrophicus]
MAIPVYLWLYEEDEKLLKGGVDITGREGSIELVGMQHDVFIPTDDMTGAATGTRQHKAHTFEKITWNYVDGNIQHADSWKERKTA